MLHHLQPSVMAVLAGLTMALCAQSPHAGVVLGATRLVYPADARQITLALDNKGDRASLVQAWIDDGDDASTPDSAHSPFMLTPPIFRMEAGQSQVLRILHTGEALPKDRESLFWLNVYDVPPKAKQAESKNTLQFAFRNRIKVFYRPAGLPGDANSAASHLRWTREQRDGHTHIRATNPTPYHVSMSAIGLGRGGVRIPDANHGPAMLAPMASTTFVFDGQASDATQVHFAIINDHGARHEETAALGK